MHHWMQGKGCWDINLALCEITYLSQLENQSQVASLAEQDEGGKNYYSFPLADCIFA